jgi:hypothetical protein
MALTNAQRDDAWLQILRQTASRLSNLLAKPDLQAAVTAVDTWATNNQASYLAALPDPFKTQSNASEKALLLAYVCLKRAGL